MPPHWQTNLPRLEEACRRSGATHDAADVLQILMTDNRAFWLATPDSFGVAEVWDYPRKRVINWSWAGGVVNDLLDFGDKFSRLAMAAGCTEVQLIGRPGWERVLGPHGYQKRGVVLRKTLGA